MSVVPPSPPMARTRVTGVPVFFARTRKAAAIRRREDLKAPRGVRRREAAVDGPHRRVDRIAGTERLTATLTGAVTGIERIRAIHRRLNRTLRRIEKTVAHREGARLIKVDLLLVHD